MLHFWQRERIFQVEGMRNQSEKLLGTKKYSIGDPMTKSQGSKTGFSAPNKVIPQLSTGTVLLIQLTKRAR